MKTLKELSSLDGRVALVTGASGHIGATFCAALAELGADVAAADLPGTGFDHQQSSTDRRHPFPVDLHDERQMRDLVPRVLERLHRLDVLVHCAALVGMTGAPGWNAPFSDQTVSAWDQAMRVNLTSAFVIAQQAREPLARSGRGSILFISSIHGIAAPDPGLYEGTNMHSPAGYGASKAGLIQLARHLAAEFAPSIRVNTLSPGGVWRGQPAQFVERYERRTPLRRMATEEDLKGAMAFLVSDLSAYVTGHNLVVDGGWTVW